MVAPCVTEGINWDMFKKKVREGSTEPHSQMGLDFDTEVSNKIEEDIHIVTKTNPKSWALDSKHIIRAFKDKKGDPIKVRSLLFHNKRPPVARGRGPLKRALLTQARRRSQ